ncbi:protein kinase, putative [Trichomonas vaginalis G3]|uniref:Protein kinase, putative n=1 Tax=Trichomonas vaginalis (strain ATCC PRA-98 / G3) TaxID=412133 RepID=A2DG25_TRIV3|nr:protein serine/threonine kinase protein [Trichomonas vaginalis G3]EAY20652.1 protein kinase, putative [Trichomonas vaginalis G3]KAI5487373.1 protein serine/threonine kinase protein [Trichomonas vaginalis G3]|eukprot:XP_001581638.1 protein kinase [Trichomonas vaginalis G3]
MTETSTKQQRFTKLAQVRSSQHDIVCSVGLDTELCVQIYWYTCLNDNLTQEDQTKAFYQLCEAKKINSPYLMNILDVSQTVKPPQFIVVTEAADSPSLATHIRQLVAPPSDKTIIRWFKSLATAVQALHNSPMKITHGEVSLNNVYFRSTPSNLKLTLPISTLSLRSVSNQALDIDSYTAPERLKGTIAQCNDIWSLGICLLELLTRETAYSEYRTPIELFDALTEYKLPESLNLVKNQAAVDLIKKCLTPPSQRIQINELLSDSIFNETSSTAATSSAKDVSQIIFV